MGYRLTGNDIEWQNENVGSLSQEMKIMNKPTIHKKALIINSSSNQNYTEEELKKQNLKDGIKSLAGYRTMIKDYDNTIFRKLRRN